MSFNQSDRLIRMTKGPLGPDEVAMTRFSGREEISRLFSFQLEFLSTDLDLKPGKIIGKDVNIEIDRRDNNGSPLAPRIFHGYINRFAAGPVALEETGKFKYRHYRAEMVPWLWFLTQTSRCFLFFPEKEDKTIFEVIEAVLDRAKSDLHVEPANDLKGINDLKKRKVKHCVQYRETDFNFVSRTLERYGAFYYFKFEDGKHTLVVDMKKNYPKCEEAEVSYPDLTGSHTPVDHITDWQHDYEFVSGKWTYTDYNFEKPSTSLKADAPKLPAIDLAQNDKYEMYDYPGEYAEKSDGQTDAKVRQEEQEVQHNIVHGTSLCRTFTPGFKFKLTDHPDEDAVSEHKNSYLLIAVEHEASQAGAETGESTPGEYGNRFTCIPDSVQFRPARITPQPKISGVQTAVVVGPEDIHTDKYGRVKVQFHWDREGKKDGNSSCWVRVSQNWGGKEWGGMFIPHCGQEVIVEFLEGDPDQPIVTGRVYNAEQVVPLPLPARKTRSIIRDHGGNQLVMEGKAGEQYINLQQQSCGNKLQMNAAPGQESIKIQDKFGNHILLSSVDKTITLYSPNHNSGMVIGKSIHAFSKSAHVTSSGGSGFEFFGGSKMSLNMGLKADLFVGVQASAAVGEKIGIFGGNNYDLSWGYKYVWTKSGTYSASSGDSTLDSKKRVIIDADDEVIILGGDNDYSRCHANDKRMIFTFKQGGSGRARASAPLPALVGTAIAAGLQIAHVADSQYTGWIGSTMPVDVGNSSTDADKTWAVETANESIGTSVASSAASLVASHMAVKSLKKVSDSRKQGISPHAAPEARVVLHKKGVYVNADNVNQKIELEKGKGISIITLDGKVAIGATKDIGLVTNGMIVHSSSKTKWDKGEIVHGNFKVLE